MELEVPSQGAVGACCWTAFETHGQRLTSKLTPTEGAPPCNLESFLGSLSWLYWLCANTDESSIHNTMITASRTWQKRLRSVDIRRNDEDNQADLDVLRGKFDRLPRCECVSNYAETIAQYPIDTTNCHFGASGTTYIADGRKVFAQHDVCWQGLSLLVGLRAERTTAPKRSSRHTK